MAIWVVLVPDAAVGAVGTPVNAGELVGALSLNVVQSVEESAPLFVAEAVGKLNV